MTTDQQRLILINKTTHASEKGLHATKNRKDQQRERKLNLCERRNWSVQIEEFTERINAIVSIIQSDS